MQSTIDGVGDYLNRKDLDWVIHTNDPLYDRWRFNQENINVTFSYLTASPNHSSSRHVNRGVYRLGRVAERIAREIKDLETTQKQIADSDLVICSGGDIFTSDYQNLRKHMSYPNIAKCAYLCSHTIGPFTKSDEKYFLKSLGNVKAISVREQLSYDYLQSLELGETKLVLCPDVAFTLRSEPSRGLEILRDDLRFGGDLNFVALSVSQGVIRYSNIDEENAINEWVDLCDLITENGFDIVFIPHVTERNPNNNDLLITRKIFDKMRCKANARIMAYEYSAVEYKSVIGFAKCLVGARTHATIASLSQLVPTISVAYSRKAYGISELIFGPESYERYIVDCKDFNSSNVFEKMRSAMEGVMPKERIMALKSDAKKNFSIVGEILDESKT